MNLFDEMRAAANGIKPARNDQWIHTKETRLAILCGAGEPTPVFVAMAEAEASEEQRAINDKLRHSAPAEDSDNTKNI